VATCPRCAEENPDRARFCLNCGTALQAAPPREERKKIKLPALVIGHPRDPLHPFSDSDALVHEMPNARLVDANSIFEWRLNPGRLNDELAAYLDEEYSTPQRARRSTAAAKESAA